VRFVMMTPSKTVTAGQCGLSVEGFLLTHPERQTDFYELFINTGEARR